MPRGGDGNSPPFGNVRRTIGMITNIFGKDMGEYTKYWLSISTENKDGGYAQASIPARLSKEAVKVFEKSAVKTKTKKIKYATFETDDFWLKAVEGKDAEYVIVFINAMKEYVKE